MDYVKYIFTLVILLAIGLIYDKFKLHYLDDDNSKHYKLVSQYLLNKDDQSLAQPNKPIMWIHTNYEINANHWASFGSRNTRNMNQPYKLLTIKSIIDKCGGDFNICMIDDSSFVKIVPDWTIDLESLADPIRSNIRRLAMARLLKTFGGMLVPGSMICLKNFRDVYDDGIKEKGGMFVGELMNSGVRGPSRIPNIAYPSTLLMGCMKDSPTMSEYIRYLERLNSTDYTAESSFVGDDSEWCMDKVASDKMKLIPGKLLGARDINGGILTLEQLMGNSYVDIDVDAIGIYIPEEEVLRRSKYQWFARLSTGQALTSDTIIGKYLVIASSESCK
tara:strand:- start:3210 stop:4208 length:999 start_codon:yes stop_codon:yes gene_type:complete